MGVSGGVVDYRQPNGWHAMIWQEAEMASFTIESDKPLQVRTEHSFVLRADAAGKLADIPLGYVGEIAVSEPDTSRPAERRRMKLVERTPLEGGDVFYRFESVPPE